MTGTPLELSSTLKKLVKPVLSSAQNFKVYLSPEFSE
jgi:hypothetical protein